MEVLSGIGYPAFLADADDRNTDPEMAELLRATAVAGFAAMNIMLLSVSIWSGATDPATPKHIPLALGTDCVPGSFLTAGRLFFVSAWRALINRRAKYGPADLGRNFCARSGLSVFDTLAGGPRACLLRRRQPRLDLLPAGRAHARLSRCGG